MPAVAGNNLKSSTSSSFVAARIHTAKNKTHFSSNRLLFCCWYLISLLILPNFLLLLSLASSLSPSSPKLDEKMRPIDRELPQSSAKRLSIYEHLSKTSKENNFLLHPTTTTASIPAMTKTNTTAKRKHRAEGAVDAKRKTTLLHLKQLHTPSSSSTLAGSSNLLMNFNQVNSSNPCYNFTVGYYPAARSSSLVLTTPNYPYTYPNSTSCVRLLEAPFGHVVRLSFDGPMRLEGKCRTSTSGIGGGGESQSYISAASPSAYARAFLATALAASSAAAASTQSSTLNGGETLADGCDCYDYIEVRDGRFGYSPAIAHFCGTFNDPQFLPNIYSTGRHLWLHFTSDASVQYDGVRLRADFVPEIDVNNGIATTFSPTQNASSHGKLGTYDGQECIIYVDIAHDGFISAAQVPPAQRTRARDMGVPLDCSWIVRAPSAAHFLLLQFVEYELLAPNSCNVNYLDVYEDVTTRDVRDRLFRFCGSDSQVLKCDAPIAVVRLYAATALAANRTRFKMLYTAFRNKLNDDDETECEKSSLFDCGDGTCINSTLVCNGNNNCLSRDDEKDCDDAEFESGGGVLPSEQANKTSGGGGIFSGGPPWAQAHVRSIVISIAAAITMVTLLICALIWTCCIRHRQKRRERDREERKLAVAAAQTGAVAAAPSAIRKTNSKSDLIPMTQIPTTPATNQQQSNGRVLMRDNDRIDDKIIMTNHLLNDQPSLYHQSLSPQFTEYDVDDDQYAQNFNNNRNLVAYTIATRKSMDAATGQPHHSSYDDQYQPPELQQLTSSSSSYQLRRTGSQSQLPPLPQGYYYYYHSPAPPPPQERQNLLLPQQQNIDIANWIQPPPPPQTANNTRTTRQQPRRQNYVNVPQTTATYSSTNIPHTPSRQMLSQQQQQQQPQNPPYFYYYYTDDPPATAVDFVDDQFSDTTASDIGGAVAAATAVDASNSGRGRPVQVLVSNSSSKSVRFNPAPTAIVEYEAEDEDDGQSPPVVAARKQDPATPGVKYYYYLTADPSAATRPSYQPFSANNNTPPLLSPPSHTDEDVDDESDSLITPTNTSRKTKFSPISHQTGEFASGPTTANRPSSPPPPPPPPSAV